MIDFMQLRDALVRVGSEEEGYRLEIDDFAVNLGQIVLVAGPSGSGKSLFLELAGLARAPERITEFLIGTSGETGGREDVAAMWQKSDLIGIARLRVQSLGFMIPSGLLASHTIRQNLALSARIADVSAKVGLNWADRLGLADLLDRKPAELSFGQKHRAALARALANDPVCLIADEPTGPLDRKRSKELADCLAEFVAEGERSAIIASHEEDLFGSFASQTYRVLEQPTGGLSQARLTKDAG